MRRLALTPPTSAINHPGYILLFFPFQNTAVLAVYANEILVGPSKFELIPYYYWSYDRINLVYLAKTKPYLRNAKIRPA
jgi:hypothetical protein